MGGKTNFAENQYADFVRGVPLPVISNWFVGLATSTSGKRIDSTPYNLNDTIFVQDDTLPIGKWKLYKVTTAGTTAAAQPAYPGVFNEAITDGTAVLTEQHDFLDDVSGIVEVTGGAYARVAIPATLTDWSGTQGAGTTIASSGITGLISNNNVIPYVDPTADWGWVGITFLADAVTAGNIWFYGGLGNPVNISNGITNIQFAADALQYLEDD